MIYQVSLIAAFVAGMVALFAPCCVSYLLPAYLGNIFKEKRRIILMTLIYSLGIMVVILPVVLGARVLSRWFFKMHDQSYLLGGVFLMGVSILSFLGIKLPMPRIAYKSKEGSTDVVSTFGMGVIAGITSACCAPVLVGVMTLSGLTPNILQALGVGVSYVLGMVTPLYLTSLFIEKGNLLEKPWLKKKITTINIGGREYVVFLSNVLGSGIFLLTGIVMIYLTLTGGLSMDMAEREVTKKINQLAFKVTQATRQAEWVNGAFGLISGYLLYKLIDKGLGK